MQSVNFWAVLGATAAATIAGGIWYSPLLFMKAWLRECGLDEASFKARNPPLLMGASVLLNLVTAFAFAICIGRHPGMVPGFQAGMIAGVFFVGTSIAMIYLFEGRSFKLFCITAGYQTLRLTLIGLVLGIWN